MRTLARCSQLLLLVMTPPVLAAPIYTGGSGGVAFGVTPYGNPVPGVPTYIPNVNSGFNDILSSPGGTYLTANPVLANNIISIGPGALPGFLSAVGGGNGWGGFGAGTIGITGPSVAFALTDPIPGGGSASYGIGTWSASFTDPVGYAGAFGSYLSIAGSVPAVGSAAVAALRTHITSANPLSPFFGVGGAGIDMPQLVLADSQVAPGVFSWVALGGAGAAMVNNGLGGYKALAIDNGAIVIPAGDTFTAISTLTIYADPASIDVYDPTSDLSLIADTGASLPGYDLITTVPEPGACSLLGLGILALSGWRARCSRQGQRS